MHERLIPGLPAVLGLRCSYFSTVTSLPSIKVLTGSATAYSSDPSNPVGKFPENAGRDTILVSAVQVGLDEGLESR